MYITVTNNDGTEVDIEFTAKGGFCAPGRHYPGHAPDVRFEQGFEDKLTRAGITDYDIGEMHQRAIEAIREADAEH